MKLTKKTVFSHGDHDLQGEYIHHLDIDDRKNRKMIVGYMLFISLAFLIATPIAVVVTHEHNFVENLVRLLTSPSKLVTDYFEIGGLGSTLFNAALCGLICNFIIAISKAKVNATTFAGYMLVVAHCFYGLNFLNMWPPFFGVVIYSKVMKKKYRENVHISFFSTALAPFISDFMFRYTLSDNFNPEQPKITVLGVCLALFFGLASGFVVPALLPGTTAMHRGFNMYKAGLALGMLGIFIYAFLYQSLGLESVPPISVANEDYHSLPYGYRSFMNSFFTVVFGATLVTGILLNKNSIHGYRALIHSTGYGTDFFDKFKMPLCLINIGVYGFAILIYLNLIFILPEIFPALPKGVGFTGPTVGVVFAALTFAADGQHPRTIFPIVVGYGALFATVCTICSISGLDIPWTLSTQGYINGLAFATGLCPFAGKYGFRIGVLAGFLSAVICTSTSQMHGGFVLYNGGFTAGLTALILLPILDFYKVTPKYNDDI